MSLIILEFLSNMERDNGIPHNGYFYRKEKLELIIQQLDLNDAKEKANDTTNYDGFNNGGMLALNTNLNKLNVIL